MKSAEEEYRNHRAGVTGHILSEDGDAEHKYNCGEQRQAGDGESDVRPNAQRPRGGGRDGLQGISPQEQAGGFGFAGRPRRPVKHDGSAAESDPC